MWHLVIAALLAAGTQAETESLPPAVKTTEKTAASAPAGPAAPIPEETPAAGDGEQSPSAEEIDRTIAVDWRKLADDILDSGAIGELRRGGFFMWPVLLLGIVSAGVVLERWRSLKLVATDSTALRSEVMDLLDADRVEDALSKCDAQQGPVPAVLAVGLRKYLVLRRLGYDPGQVSDHVVRSMDDYSVHIVAALERHLPILATVASVAPMLGFLGTVQGMVIAFREIVERMGETNIVEAAATGINIALLTTVFGLIVGIPTYIAYNYYTSVINGYVLQVEESATELIETVTLKMALEQGAPRQKLVSESLPDSAMSSEQ